eukprot:6258123-Pyramimonas_sp.AAC.1
MLAKLSEDPSKFKGTVIVIRYEGPKGGPGMPEMLTPTSAIMGAGLGKECALLTDGEMTPLQHPLALDFALASAEGVRIVKALPYPRYGFGSSPCGYSGGGAHPCRH